MITVTAPPAPEQLRDPLPDLAEHLRAALAGHWAALTGVTAVAVLGAVVTLLVRRAVRRGWWRDARILTVLAPAGLDATAAVTGGRRLWRDLMGITHPPLRRLLGGQPHLCLEYRLAGGQEMTVRVWVPGPIAHGRVENAIRTAWPGALVLREHTDRPATPLTDAAVTQTGGVVRPERADYLPLHVPEPRDDSDPLRTLEALTGELAAGETAVVQVLARPAAGRRLRRYRTAVRRLHAGQPARTSWATTAVTSLVRTLLDIATPGRPATGTTATRPVRSRAGDALRSDELRGIRDKAAHPQWEVALRYAVTTTEHGPEARERVRGVADAVFAVFTVLAGRNALARHRLHRPARAVGARKVRHGALFSVPELASLAHLPVRTSALATGNARSVPAPRTVTRPLTDPATTSTPAPQARNGR